MAYYQVRPGAMRTCFCRSCETRRTLETAGTISRLSSPGNLVALALLPRMFLTLKRPSTRENRMICMICRRSLARSSSCRNHRFKKGEILLEKNNRLGKWNKKTFSGVENPNQGIIVTKENNHKEDQLSAITARTTFLKIFSRLYSS